MAARRIGTLGTALGVLLISLVGLIALADLTHAPMLPDPAWLPRISLLGILAGLGYVLVVQALRLGPISVVSPIGATVGAVTVVLAVLTLGEHPSAGQWTGVLLAAVGSILTAFTSRPGSWSPRLVGSGAIYAVAAVMCYAISVVGLRDPIREAGLLQTVLTWRFWNVAVAASFVVAARFAGNRRGIIGRLLRLPQSGSDNSSAVRQMLRDRHPLKSFEWAGFAMLVLAGLFESIGQVTRGAGLSIAPVWFVGMLGATSPVVVVAGGFVFLGERLKPSQWAGLILILGGVALIGSG